MGYYIETMTKDIQSRSDIKQFVVGFYEKARRDILLGGVFQAAVPDSHWPQHIERIVDFWESALFDANLYRGSTFAVHRDLPINGQHFERWLELFNSTIDSLFSGDVAEDTKNRAKNMGALFQSKIEYLNNNPHLKNIH